MQVCFNIENEYREKVFIDEGIELPKVAKLDIDVKELLPNLRADISRNRKYITGGEGRLEVPYVNENYVATENVSIKAHESSQADEIILQWVEKVSIAVSAVDAWRRTRIAELTSEFREMNEKQLCEIVESNSGYYIQMNDHAKSLSQVDITRDLGGEGDDLTDLLTTQKTLINRRKFQEDVAKEKIQRMLEIREDRRRLIRDQREQEKTDWVRKNGSDFLKKSLANGYDCQRKYVEERAAIELPGFVIDFDNEADWKSRSCPSEKALDLAIDLKGQGLDASVKWLTVNEDGEELAHPDAELDEDDFRLEFQCEVVAVTNYLGKYDAFKYISLEQ